MTEHTDSTLVRLGYEALDRGDLAVLRRLYAPDAELTVTGAGPLAGLYRGRDEIIAHHAHTFELTGGTFRAELRAMTAADGIAVTIQRTHAQRRGDALDTGGAAAFQLRAGRIVSVWQVYPDTGGFWL